MSSLADFSCKLLLRIRMLKVVGLGPKKQTEPETETVPAIPAVLSTDDPLKLLWLWSWDRLQFSYLS